MQYTPTMKWLLGLYHLRTQLLGCQKAINIYLNWAQYVELWNRVMEDANIAQPAPVPAPEPNPANEPVPIPPAPPLEPFPEFLIPPPPEPIEPEPQGEPAGNPIDPAGILLGAAGNPIELDEDPDESEENPDDDFEEDLEEWGDASSVGSVTGPVGGGDD
ncbi:hypothetical protein RHMOL_Rhmol07G0223300 [Rhododendron molle]|uniref:Uncharacterized protein n=1 Tax=Rhododendron molle TaxID=49168 RepID=A0ACC0N389_RHOML|nr:hypothetical protein RHMOL_Rhmol07G0223300 [Rhododendron molle]